MTELETSSGQRTGCRQFFAAGELGTPLYIYSEGSLAHRSLYTERERFRTIIAAWMRPLVRLVRVIPAALLWTHPRVSTPIPQWLHFFGRARIFTRKGAV
jgi:hypothetical protein